MNKLIIATLLLLSVLAAPAAASPADYWVDNHSNGEAQGWYDFSNQISSGNSGEDSSQTAVVNSSQRGPVSVDDSDSNDTNDVNGSNILPIVGNDVLGNADILNNTLANNSTNDSSTTSISQSRSEDNRVTHTTVIEDSFNATPRVPTIVLSDKAERVAPSGSLPRTGHDYYSPLALALWLIVAGFMLVKVGRGGIPRLAKFSI